MAKGIIESQELMKQYVRELNKSRKQSSSYALKKLQNRYKQITGSKAILGVDILDYTGSDREALNDAIRGFLKSQTKSVEGIDIVSERKKDVARDLGVPIEYEDEFFELMNMIREYLGNEIVDINSGLVVNPIVEALSTKKKFQHKTKEKLVSAIVENLNIKDETIREYADEIDRKLSLKSNTPYQEMIDIGTDFALGKYDKY